MSQLGRSFAAHLVGIGILAGSAWGQEPAPPAERARAESIVAAEEARSGRAFDPAFRARATALLASRPAADPQDDAGGLGLSALGETQADLVYTPLTPCRIIDTRLVGEPVAAGTKVDFYVAGNGYASQGGNPSSCGVPYGPATAAVINFVAVSPDGPGNLQLAPFGQELPLSSIINYRAGVNLANGLVVALCDPSTATCDSDVTIQANNSGTHIVADVQGYFQSVTAGGVGTALLADGAVTAPKIGTGAVVRSLNGQTDAVTLQGSNGVQVWETPGTVMVQSDATWTNAPGAIVARDSSGGFSAGTIVANLAGNATTATTAAGFTGSLAGEVTGTQGATVVSNATAGNVANAVVRRDASGSFWAGSLSLSSILELSTTTSASAGVLRQAGAPFLHTFGGDNTFLGTLAGNFTMVGRRNSGFGYQALGATVSGENSAFGYRALAVNATGFTNSAFGRSALAANTTGYQNSAFGSSALQANVGGYWNSAFGESAATNTTGSQNSAFGTNALYTNAAGERNSAFGNQALFSLSAGHENSAFGTNALVQLASGGSNVAIGHGAGNALTSGDNNIYVGSGGATSESNTIRIGNTQTATYVAGISGATSASGAAVFVNISGKLGTVTSSRRYKEEIVDMGAESDVLSKLRPVSFYYRPELDETHTRQYGLVAEEVAEVAPELVVRDDEGRPQTVRYHFVNALLLNEVQKQRRRIETQEAEIRDLRAGLARVEELKAELARLEARLDEE